MGGVDRSHRRAAVLGSPIAHSLSPVLHRAAYATLGLDWRYDAVEVDAAGLADVLAGLDPSWVGLSLTMPLKRAAVSLCDAVSVRAAEVGAVNTVLLHPDGSRYGENTDVPGLVAALREAGVRRPPDRVAVLGAGATASSVLAAVAALGGPPGSVEVYARSRARAAEILAAASRIGIPVDLRSWSELTGGLGADLVISTVPAAASAEVARAVPGRVGGTLFDVVYDPWPTRLARAWLASGGAVVGGLALLIHQAALQVELMTGINGAADRLVPVMTAAVADRDFGSPTRLRP